nr:hypothetical protein Iba_chr12eCG7280 [Ipomoea batatas]
MRCAYKYVDNVENSLEIRVGTEVGLQRQPAEEWFCPTGSFPQCVVTRGVSDERVQRDPSAARDKSACELSDGQVDHGTGETNSWVRRGEKCLREQMFRVRGAEGVALK